MYESDDELIARGLQCTKDMVQLLATDHLPATVAGVVADYACYDACAYRTLVRATDETFVATVAIGNEKWECSVKFEGDYMMRINVENTGTYAPIPIMSWMLDLIDTYRTMANDDNTLMEMIEKPYREQNEGPALKVILHLTAVIEQLAAGLMTALLAKTTHTCRKSG